MKNRERWTPSKYVFSGSALRGSRDRRDLAVSSRLITDRLAERLQAVLPRVCRGRLVDLGCGRTPLFHVYRDHVSEVTCVDSPDPVHGNEFLDLEWDLGRTPLPYPAERFDTVILSDVLEHLPRPAEMLGEIRRLLAPGGGLVLSVPFLYGIHEAPHDHYRYTEFALRNLVTEAGLEVIELEAYGGLPEVLLDLSAKLAARLPGGAILADVLQRTGGWCTRRGPGRTLSLRTRAAFPLGYLMVARRPDHGVPDR